MQMKGLALVGALLMAPGVPMAQSPEDPEAQRTPWGAPDLRGVWDFRTLTPLERPRNLEGKASFTDEEAAEFERRAIERRAPDGARDRSVHAYWWLDYGTEVNEDQRPAGWPYSSVDICGAGDGACTAATPRHAAAGARRRRQRAGGSGPCRALHYRVQLWSPDRTECI